MAHRHPLTARLRRIAPAAALLALLAAPAAARPEGTVLVRPDRVTLLPGDGIRFRAEPSAEWAGAAVLFTWEVIPRRLGSVDPQGYFVAGGEPGRGILRVEARSGDRRAVGHALVRVAEGEARSLLVRVEPAEAVTEPGGEVSFLARAFDPSTGEEIAGTTEWRIVPADLGGIDAGGLFRAGDRPGHGRIAAIVVAGERRGIGYARVRVGGGAPETPVEIRVIPPEAETAPGGVILFLAETDPPGAAGPIQWIAVPERIGVVTGGRFLAGPFPGEGRIIASLLTESGFARGESRVRVRGTGAAAASVRPAEATLRAGDEIRFRLVAATAAGQRSLEPVEWSVNPPEAGWIAPDGLFHSSEAADRSLVEARVNGLYRDPETGTAVEGAARVRILGDPTGAALRVRPAAAIVDPGEQVRFTVENAMSDQPLFWDLVPPDLGTITPDGLFTANRVFADAAGWQSGRREGSVLVRSTGSGRARVGKARILVGSEVSAAQLVIDPPSWTGEISLEAALSGKGIPFRARVANAATDAPAVVHWRLEPAGHFRVEPAVGDRTTVVFAGGNAGTQAENAILYQGNLVAESIQSNSRRIGAAAPLRITLQRTRLLVKASPSSLDLPAGDEASVVVSVEGPGGTPVDPARVVITGKVYPARLGTYSPGTGVFRAEREGVGTLVISAAVPGWPIAGKATVPVRVRDGDARSGER